MRIFILSALALLGACAQPQAGRCDFTETRQVAFTSAEAQDRITVRSFGVSCDKAIGVYEIIDAEGHPIWAWATPLQRAFGDVFKAEEPEHMQTFLEEWTQPAILTTQAAPEWNALQPGQTTIDEFTYADIRARDLPMLCHFSGTARQTCVFWEPVAGGAGHLFDRDVEETVQ
jgi:hypothetical protein